MHDKMKKQGKIYGFVGCYCRSTLFGFIVIMGCLQIWGLTNLVNLGHH